MSAPELSEQVARTATDAPWVVVSLVTTLVQYVLLPVRAAAFWIAALLPFSYLPMLATGVVGEHPLGFLGLLSLNGVAVLVRADAGEPAAADDVDEAAWYEPTALPTPQVPELERVIAHARALRDGA